MKTKVCISNCQHAVPFLDCSNTNYKQ